MNPTKTPTRDYPSLASNDWALWKTIYARRSNRKYLPMELDAEMAGRIGEASSLALKTREARPGSIMVETDPAQVDRIRKAAYRGIEGAINLWLMRSPICAFLVMVVPREELSSDYPEVLPYTVMATEDMVLWLTEKGLGTCWLGGVNDRELRKVMGLSGELTIPVIISIGKPKANIRAMNFDSLLYRQLSRHRKPISTIASRDTHGRPFGIGKVPSEKFAVSATQDVEGLLRLIDTNEMGRSDVPAEIAVEACLEAARVAPSASNKQKWHFTAMLQRRELDKVEKTCNASGWRAAIVGAGFPGKLHFGVEKPYWLIDLPIAFSNMSLMATSMDIPFDICLNECDRRAVRTIAGLPEELSAFGVLGLR